MNDPMTEVHGRFSIGKTNLCRTGFDQPTPAAGANLAQNAQAYCQNLIMIQVASLERDQALLTGAPSADPAVGDNLFTFLAARLSGSFGNLGCAAYGMANPVSLTLDANGVAIGATFSGAPAGSEPPTPTAPPSP